MQNMNKVSRKFKHSSPTIIACIGAIGVVATAVLAIKATPKAMKLLEAAKEEKGEALTNSETIIVATPCYIPAVITCVATIGCIFGANVLTKRNQASLASAYALLNQSYKRYREAANNVFGDDADSQIKVQMAKDVYISADGYSLYSADLDSESGKILCYDLFSERYFTTTMAAVLNAEYHVNRNLSLRGEVCINEFYEFLGLESIDGGEDFGWTIDEFIEQGIMWLDFENSRAKMDDGMECCVVSALWDPIKL